jgi:hypothetical protein
MSGRTRSALAAAVAALSLAVAGQASAYELIARGKTGRSVAKKGTCKYGVFGPRGVLMVGISAPVVTGANTRRRVRGERTFVRYLVDVTNAAGSNETVLRSGWSPWFSVRQGQWASLPPSSFDMDWRAYYGADVLIQWWTSRRKLGFRWHRLEEFLYTDNYNRGPYGPFSSCYWVFPR